MPYHDNPEPITSSQSDCSVNYHCMSVVDPNEYPMSCEADSLV